MKIRHLLMWPATYSFKIFFVTQVTHTKNFIFFSGWFPSILVCVWKSLDWLGWQLSYFFHPTLGETFAISEPGKYSMNTQKSFELYSIKMWWRVVIIYIDCKKLPTLYAKFKKLEIGWTIVKFGSYDLRPDFKTK